MAGRMKAVTLDIDSAEELDNLWRQVRARQASRLREPELHEAITRRLDDLVAEGRLSRIEADLIKHEMGQVLPSVVLASYRDVLVPDVPALGAYISRQEDEVQLAA